MANSVVQFEPMTPALALTLIGARAVYEPSVFGGDGTEIRKNIVLEVEPEIVTEIRSQEAKLDSSRLCSCLKGNHLKCKINMQKVNAYSPDNASQTLPETWRDQTMNAFVVIKRIWNTKRNTGLSLEVTDVQLAPQTPAKSPFAVRPSEAFMSATRAC